MMVALNLFRNSCLHRIYLPLPPLLVAINPVSAYPPAYRLRRENVHARPM